MLRRQRISESSRMRGPGATQNNLGWSHRLGHHGDTALVHEPWGQVTMSTKKEHVSLESRSVRGGVKLQLDE